MNNGDKVVCVQSFTFYDEVCFGDIPEIGNIYVVRHSGTAPRHNLRAFVLLLGMKIYRKSDNKELGYDASYFRKLDEMRDKNLKENIVTL
jgi:hypothetical protein